MRAGLVGPNGSGKTTLLKVLEGTIDPDEGGVRRAAGLRIVSFAQDRTEHLDLAVSLRRALCPEGDMVLYRDRPVHVAGWAKRFLFREEQLEMPVASLSGGERARVLIARVMLQPADVLLLDEPTNDLDIPTLEVLEESLLEFPGALVMVSHDRYLLDRVSTMVIAIENGEACRFADYSQWESARREKPGEKSAEKPVRAQAPTPAAEGRKKLGYLEQREFDSMEARILEAEAELSRWESEIQDAAAEPGRLIEAVRKADEARALVDKLYARWAELESR
jgi:ATP-binding cassette subfamily F protein uup